MRFAGTSQVCYEILQNAKMSRRIQRHMSSDAARPTATYVLNYKYVSDMATKRTNYREGHLTLLKSLQSKNQLVAAGAFLPNIDGGMFIFKGDKKVVEDFVQADPYVAAGLVTEVVINEWSIAVGGV